MADKGGFSLHSHDTMANKLTDNSFDCWAWCFFLSKVGTKKCQTVASKRFAMSKIWHGHLRAASDCFYGDNFHSTSIKLFSSATLYSEHGVIDEKIASPLYYCLRCNLTTLSNCLYYCRRKEILRYLISPHVTILVPNVVVLSLFPSWYSFLIALARVPHRNRLLEWLTGLSAIYLFPLSTSFYC